MAGAQAPPTVVARGRDEVHATVRERVAPTDASSGEPGALDRAVPLQRGHRVARAGRVVPASRTEQGTQPPLVQPDDRDEEPTHGADRRASTPRAEVRRHRSRSSARRALDAVAARLVARITTCSPGRRSPRRERATWRRRRLTRWRTTDDPTALLTTSPTRGSSSGPTGESLCSAGAGLQRCSTTVDEPTLRPRRMVRRKSEDRRIRFRAASTVRPSGECAPWTGGSSRSIGPHASACGHESHGSSRACECWAERCASRCGSRAGHRVTAADLHGQRRQWVCRSLSEARDGAREEYVSADQRVKPTSEPTPAQQSQEHHPCRGVNSPLPCWCRWG